MKLIKGRVHWFEGFANDPVLQILVDKLPEMDELRYEEKDGIYYGEKDGYVSFYYYVQPGQGFCGRSFKLTMKDGEEKTLIGPWSSNAGAAHGVGFGPCVDVNIIDNLESYERGYTFYAGHVTLDLIERNKHLIEIGSHYNQKLGTGHTEEKQIEFPTGSSLVMLENKRYGHYSPCVLMPDGQVWSKNNLDGEKRLVSDLSAEQSGLI